MPRRQARPFACPTGRVSVEWCGPLALRSRVRRIARKPRPERNPTTDGSPYDRHGKAPPPSSFAPRSACTSSVNLSYLSFNNLVAQPKLTDVAIGNHSLGMRHLSDGVGRPSAISCSCMRFQDLVFARSSRQYFMHDLTVDVRQAERPTLEPEGQLGVIEPQQMHHRGMEVVDVHTILHYVEP